MNNTTIAVVLALLLVAGGFFFYNKYKMNEAEHTLTNAEQAISEGQNQSNTPSDTPSEEANGSTIDPADIQTTPSGLQYVVLEEGTGAHPTIDNTVVVHYHGTLPDGSVFDSSVERGTPAEFPLRGLIRGWQEGIPLMSVGSTYKFIIPPELAYGTQGHPLANQTLIFDITLIDVK